MYSHYVAQVFSEWFWNGSICPYYYWYHVCFYVSHENNIQNNFYTEWCKSHLTYPGVHPAVLMTTSLSSYLTDSFTFPQNQPPSRPSNIQHINPTPAFFLDCMTLEYANYRLSRNVGNEIPLYSAITQSHIALSRMRGSWRRMVKMSVTCTRLHGVINQRTRRGNLKTSQTHVKFTH